MSNENRMSKRSFAERLAAIAMTFDKELPKQVADIYWEALRPYPADTLERAFVRAIRECTFFPKPAELIAFIEGTPLERAEVAWNAMLTAMSKVGAGASVRFWDATIHAVILSLGGWQQVCLWEESELPYRRREFMALYAAHRGAGERPEYAAGSVEVHNRERFPDHVPEPHRIMPGERAGEVRVIEPPPVKALGGGERKQIEAGASE